MDSKKELRKLSKNELINIIFKLEERLKKIEGYIKAFDNPHTPSSKQNKKNTKNKEENDKKEEDNSSNNEKPKKPRFPGKPKGGNGGGIKLPDPDQVMEHSLEFSPETGESLGEPINQRIQTVIDFPDKPIVITKHIIYQYKDPTTGNIIEPYVDLPKGIYGKNLQSIVIMLKEMVNSKINIAKFIQELGAPSFSHTTIQNISTLFIHGMTPERNKILIELKKEEYAHSDETGIRLDGINRYVWGLFSKTRAIFQAGITRASYNFKKLIRNIRKKIVLVVDGYKGYDYYTLKQRCWAHLLRDFKDFASKNEEIKIQYNRVKKLYEFIEVLNNKPPDEKEIEKAKWNLKDIITCLKNIKEANKLVTLIENGGDDWFTALYYEGVPLTNNLAERELRKIVLLRKTIGCIRNWKGKRWIEVVMSVLHTWRLQNKNIFENLKLYAT
jgi:transposase